MNQLQLRKIDRLRERTREKPRQRALTAQLRVNGKIITTSDYQMGRRWFVHRFKQYLPLSSKDFPAITWRDHVEIEVIEK